jgi:glyoxylase-like metal-dependent hydrolase (beta-lactamase superfamily II)
MSELDKWFEIDQHKDYLFVIRENLDDLDPRYYTTYINMYLLIGTTKALLIDTGCGIYPLKPIIKRLIENKELMVINTHSHFDHRGGNEEFGEIWVHEKEYKDVSTVCDVLFLKSSPKQVVTQLEKKDFKYQPAKVIHPLKEGDKFDLGGITIEIVHTPGHSTGSISILTNNNEFFTGDTAHYGAMYLPKPDEFPIILESLQKMLEICKNKEKIELYPAHEDYAVGKELLKRLIEGIINIDDIWNSKKRDEFLDSWILDDGKFKYVVK